MMSEPKKPHCRECNKPVDEFRIGKSFLGGGTCYFESKCHGETERFEYRSVSRGEDPFVPDHAFPAERPTQAAVDPIEFERTAMDVQAELISSTAWKRLARVRHFSISIRLLDRNAEELLSHLSFLTEDPRSMPLSYVYNRGELDRQFEEVLRLLHNFVAAAHTLVDHTRDMHVELYADGSLFSDYQREVDARFSTHPLSSFVKCLRQFAQHIRLPHISYDLSVTLGAAPVRCLSLQKADLLSENCWKAPAKVYLKEAPEKIDLAAVVRDYVSHVRAFYVWIQGRQQEIHAGDFAEVEKLQAEGIKLLAKDIPRHLQTGLKIHLEGVGSLRDIFAFGFSPGDWETLSTLNGDLPAWVEAALALTETRFGALSSELVGRIRDAARAREVKMPGE